MNEKLLKNINHYGVDIELRKLNEEVFELQETIIVNEFIKRKFPKYHEIFKRQIKEHITEELADVQVLLNQFKLYYEIPDEEVKEVMIKKIERQMERIENDCMKYMEEKNNVFK